MALARRCACRSGECYEKGGVAARPLPALPAACLRHGLARPSSMQQQACCSPKQQQSQLYANRRSYSPTTDTALSAPQHPCAPHTSLLDHYPASSSEQSPLLPPPKAGRRWFLYSAAAAASLLPLQPPIAPPTSHSCVNSGPAWWLIPIARASDGRSGNDSGSDLIDLSSFAGGGGDDASLPATDLPSTAKSASSASPPTLPTGSTPSAPSPSLTSSAAAAPEAVPTPNHRRNRKRRHEANATNNIGSREPGRGLQQQPQQGDLERGVNADAASRAGKPLALVGKVQLAPGLAISKVVKGCLQLDGRHHGEPSTDRTSGGSAIRGFEDFVCSGITTFDTADTYGNSESIIGQYLRLFPWRRDEVQVLTKVTFLGDDMSTINRDLLEYRVKAALLRSGAAQLDLVQLHWGDFRVRGSRDVALWLGDLQQRGLIANIGVTNYDVPHLLQLLDAGLPIVSNQVQFSVLDRRPQLYMAPLCEKRGVKLLAYGTLAGGLISKRSIGLAAREARLDTPSKAKYGQILQQLGGWSYMQELLEALSRVASRHQVSVSAVATRWVLQQPSVAAALVGARNSRHCRELRVAAAPDWELDDGDMLELDAVAEGVRSPATGDVYAWERGGEW